MTEATQAGRSLLPGRALGLRGAAAVFGVALLVRIAYVLVFLRNYHPQTDAQHYIDIATSIAHGNGFAAKYPYGFEHATAFRPPLYPLLLGTAFAIFGVHLAVAQALNVILGSGVVVLIAIVAARVGGRRAGLIAAGLATIYPPLLANDGVSAQRTARAAGDARSHLGAARGSPGLGGHRRRDARADPAQRATDRAALGARPVAAGGAAAGAGLRRSGGRRRDAMGDPQRDDLQPAR